MRSAWRDGESGGDRGQTSTRCLEARCLAPRTGIIRRLQSGDRHRTGRPMDLEATLRTAVSNLISNRLENEAQVKQAVILPILRALEWDDADPMAFKPEYAVEGGFVDYALLDRSKPRVFVEAKRKGAISPDGEAQLFRYAAHQGVPLLVLTDGNLWALYLSMAEGLPSERRFFAVELERAEIQSCAENLRSLLRKARVVSGAARREAERRHESVRSRLRAREGLQTAWQALLAGPDEMLRDLLAEKVESDSGNKPEVEDVESFLQGLVSTSPPRPDTPARGKDQHLPSKRHRPHSGSKILGFTLDGQRVETGSAIATLATIIRRLDKKDPQFMQRFAEATAGKRRRLVARERSDLYDKAHLETHSAELGNGWWMGTNLSSATIRKHIEAACRVAGIRFGSQLTLIEQ